MLTQQALVITAIVVQYFGFPNEKFEEVKMLAIAFSWTLLRLWGRDMFMTEVDKLNLRHSEPRQFGDGLAVNYWCGFLKFLFHIDNTEFKFQIVTAMHSYENSNSINFASHEFFLLIPKSCDYPNVLAKSARLRKEKDLIVPIHSSLKRQVKRPDINLNVYNVTSSQGVSYFVVADAPNVLKTGLGPSDDYQVDSILRQRLIHDFQQYLEKFIFLPFSKAANERRLPARFVEFDDTEWTGDQYPDFLADKIVEVIENRTGDLQEIISTDEFSD